MERSARPCQGEQNLLWRVERWVPVLHTPPALTPATNGSLLLELRVRAHIIVDVHGDSCHWTLRDRVLRSVSTAYVTDCEVLKYTYYCIGGGMRVWS